MWLVKPKKAATQAVEELKRHAQVATSLQDRLDALTSERLEEHGVKPAHKHQLSAQTLSPQRRRRICTDRGRDGIICPKRLPMTKSPGSPSPVPHPGRGLEEY